MCQVGPGLPRLPLRSRWFLHLPDGDFPAAVLKQDVGAAVVVVVADPHDVPARPRVSDTAGTDYSGAVQLPENDLSEARRYRTTQFVIYVVAGWGATAGSMSRCAG
jgi:hypothetical protein